MIKLPAPIELPVGLIEETIELLESVGWCQHRFARYADDGADADGQYRVTAYCSVGALSTAVKARMTVQLKGDPDAVDALYAAHYLIFRAMAANLPPVFDGSIGDWNDDAHTTKEDVILMFKQVGEFLRQLDTQ